jgi:hypothetical protein
MLSDPELRFLRIYNAGGHSNPSYYHTMLEFYEEQGAVLSLSNISMRGSHPNVLNEKSGCIEILKRG